MFLKGFIILLKDLKIGYSKIDSKDHALFKVKAKIILIHKFIDPPRQSNPQRYQPVDNQFKCFYCGTNCQFKPQCPARNVVCHLCNKICHFSRVCQSSRRVPPQQGYAPVRDFLSDRHTKVNKGTTMKTQMQKCLIGLIKHLNIRSLAICFSKASSLKLYQAWRIRILNIISGG